MKGAPPGFEMNRQQTYKENKVTTLDGWEVRSFARIPDYKHMSLIAHPHLLVQATSERFLPAGSTFRHGLASESHWLQPVLVLTGHW